jgi:hypothetical protein
MLTRKEIEKAIIKDLDKQIPEKNSFTREELISIVTDMVYGCLKIETWLC